MSTENPTIDTIRGKGESHPVDPRRRGAGGQPRGSSHGP